MSTTAIFHLVLIEDESGCVTVQSDFCGFGVNATELGLDILNNLALMEKVTPDALNVRPAVFSSDHIQ